MNTACFKRRPPVKFILIFLVLFPFALQPQSAFPGWAEGIVWYQIFPERFANGDTANDPAPEKVFINFDTAPPEEWEITPWTSNWFAASAWEKNLGGTVRDHMYTRRYGGDIQGIIDNLDYIKELGIGAVYLNPVFEAVSLHKYDGSTFHHIDINFGPAPENDEALMQAEAPHDIKTWSWTEADKLFLKLIDEVHKRDMKIIIDGVFNHVGEQFWAFQDVVKNQEKSIYKDWFIIKEFDDPVTDHNEFDYEGWWGIKSLPMFNRSENDLHPGPKQYIFHSTERWMDPNGDGDPSDGIDGWRLDVARDVPLGFWKDWSKLVKSINPKSIIIGELWELSPDFVSEEGIFDALMNYSFAYAVNQFFIAKEKRISTGEFVNKLKEIDKAYPDKYLNLLQNLMTSHDTERLSSMIANPDRNYDRDAHEGTDFNPGKPAEEDYEMQKLIAAFQMTYRGAPMIYYGDEIGMWGADDPHDRKPMVWDHLKYDDEVIDETSGFKFGYGRYSVEQNKELLSFYKKLTSIRNKNKALKTGDLRFLYSNDDKRTFVFERREGDNRIVAAFNLGEEKDTFELSSDKESTRFEELISDETGSFSEGKFKIEIPAMGVKVYKIK